MKATPHRSGGKTGGGRTGPNYDGFLRIATNRLPGDHALHRPPAGQANLRDGLLLSLRLGEPRRTGAAYRVTPAACVIAPESADSTARAEQDWDGSGFSRLPKIAPVPDHSRRPVRAHRAGTAVPMPRIVRLTTRRVPRGRRRSARARDGWPPRARHERPGPPPAPGPAGARRATRADTGRGAA